MVQKNTQEELSVYDQPSLQRRKVKMRNKGEVIEVVESAFEKVWSKRGWTLVKNDADVTGGLTAVDDRNSEDHKVEPKKEKD